MSNNTKPQMQQQVNVDLTNIPDEACGAKLKDQTFKQDAGCDGIEFMKVYRFRRISAIVSPTGREHVIQLEFNKCLKCGAVKVVK